MSHDAETILQTVRRAVVEGEYARLRALLPDLQAADSELVTGDLAGLRRLKTEAERTEACLLSALHGVRAARRRVAQVAEATRGLTTYDRGGQKATVPVTVPTTRRV